MCRRPAAGHASRAVAARHCAALAVAASPVNTPQQRIGLDLHRARAAAAPPKPRARDRVSTEAVPAKIA